MGGTPPPLRKNFSEKGVTDLGSSPLPPLRIFFQRKGGYGFGGFTDKIRKVVFDGLPNGSSKNGPSENGSSKNKRSENGSSENGLSENWSN